MSRSNFVLIAAATDLPAYDFVACVRLSSTICIPSKGLIAGYCGTSIAKLSVKSAIMIVGEETKVSKKLLTLTAVSVLAFFGSGCTTADQTNVNANVANMTTTRTAADGSVITTTTDASGVKTETRVFRDNPRISRVVVTTTADGRRTARAYSPSGEEKEINDVGDALEVTGDKIADGARWTFDKAEDVGEKTVEGAKTVGEKTAEGATVVGEKTAQGAKTVGKKTAAGAKKAGSAIKDAITP